MIQTTVEPRRIRLHPATQYSVYSDPARFKVLVAGRRMGKSYLLLAIMLRQALRYARQNVLYVAPTRGQAKDIMWDLLKGVARPYLSGPPMETELRVEFVNGSRITLFGAEAADRKRGPGYDLVCFDEFSDMDPRIWHEVIRPALADRKGSAVFCGTPKGFDHFHDLYVQAGDLDDWQRFSFTTLDGGRVDSQEIEAARAQMSERQFRQEFLASFEAMEGRVYYAFDRAHSVLEDVTDTGGELHVGMDFNVAPMCAVVMVRAGDQWHVIDELVLMHSNTVEMCQEIQSRYPNRSVTVYPDPSGRARKTSAPVGQTDFSIIRDHGFRLVAGKNAPPVADRVNELNAVLCNADGVRRLFAAPKCRETIKALEGLTYKEGTSQPDKSLGLDHITDALGYAIHELEPLVRHVVTSRHVNFW